MFWDKKSDQPGGIQQKTDSTGKSPQWNFKAPAEELEVSAWEKLQLKVLSPAEVESMLGSRFGKIRSALGSGTLIQGKLSFDTPVRIDGRLSGEVFSSEALIVGSSGVVDAQLEVSSLIVLGSVKGRIKASQRIELYAGGRLEGEIITPMLKVEEGASFGGKCLMPAEQRDAIKNRPAASGKSPAADLAGSKPAVQPGKPGATDEVQLH